MIRRFRAELFLLFATIIWGGTFPVISVLVQGIDPAYVVAIRFALAATILLPFLWRGGFLRRLKAGFTDGVILGCFTLAGLYLQTLGLVYTTPARSAFITYLLVIFVLIYQVIWDRRKPTLTNYISTLILLLGGLILVNPTAQSGGETGGWFGINQGDIITVFSAAAFAGYILRVDRTWSKGRLVSLLFWQFFLCSLGGFLLAGITSAPLPVFSATSVLLILYLALPASLLTITIMLKYQPETTPVRASILYALEPIFATLIAILYPGVWPTTTEWAGGMIIFGGVIVSELSMAIKKNGS